MYILQPHFYSQNTKEILNMSEPSILIWATTNQNPFVIHHIILVWPCPNWNPSISNNVFK